MISKWFNDDVNSILKEHRYVVVTDIHGDGEFLLDYLPKEIVRLKVEDLWTELKVRFLAESEYANDKIVFYSRIKADNLEYLQEYVQTSGLLVLDDMETYIRQKIFSATGKNTTISRDKILLAAKMSDGKDIKWWRSVADGAIEPFRINDWLIDFLYCPTETRRRMDESVWNVFKNEVYRCIDHSYTNQTEEIIAQEIVDVILQSLLLNNINETLFDVYCKWADSAEKVGVLKQYVDNFEILPDTDALNAHSDHPFEKLDRNLIKRLSYGISHQQDTSDIISFLKKRTTGRKAKYFKPAWLTSILTLITFHAEKQDYVKDYSQLAEYYQNHFAKLDTAMRKIYVSWLNDEPTLRPLQEYYTRLNKELLTKWYSIDCQYRPSQQNVLAKVFSCSERTAVIVCDGLRLEIAECVVNNLTDKNLKVSRDVALAVLPSVTENGMSSLFGCDEPTTNSKSRFEKLKESILDVEIMPLDMLNDGTTAERLVLMYGDIDQVGEKKQLGGMKDIDNYEVEIGEKISMLFRLGYQKVVVTADHGFVITGILDEADKEPRPNGQILKLEERYILTDTPLPPNSLIEVEKKYFNSSFQYYAKTDKPFVTRGKYGYSHGGFTPQECIIPVYELTTNKEGHVLGVSIINKEDLKNVVGNHFVIKIRATANTSDLFTQERKVKILTFAKGKLLSDTHTCSIQPGDEISKELNYTSGLSKIVLIDKDTNAQIDSCEIIKSSSRDIEGLF